MVQNSALFDSTVRHQVYVEKLKSYEANQFAAFLKEMDKDIRKRLSGEDLTEFSRARLEQLLASIEVSLNRIFKNHYEDLAGHLIEIGQYESEFESRNLENASGGEFEAVIPAPNQVRAAIFSAPLSIRTTDGGKMLESFIKDWSAGEIKAVTGAIRQGFFEGKTTAQILQTIRGTAKNKFRDGLLSVVDRHAATVVRTAVQHVASEARFQTWEANKEIITGYQWVSTLDNKTSPTCRSLDGMTFDRGEGPKPPVHPNCRSTTIAVLDKRYSFADDPGKRASKDGPVAADETYYSWLKKQHASFQDSVLGPTRGKLFRDGGLTAERFAELNLGRNFKPLTLTEMKRLEPNAFEKAFSIAKEKPDIVPENKIFETAKDYVVTNGRKYGGEFAFIADRRTGEVLVKKRGSRSSVTFTEEEISRISKADNAEIYHNHPSGASLSVADLTFAAYTGLNKIVALATSGPGKYEATTKGSVKDLQSHRLSIETYLNSWTDSLLKSKTISVTESRHLHPHAYNSILDSIGAIEYRAHELSRETEAAINKIGKRYFRDWVKAYER